MAGTELGQSALERVEPQRGRLAAALRDYELAVLNPDTGWADGVGVPLGRLRAAFDEHVEFTEGPDGLFEQMLDDMGAIASSWVAQLPAS